MVASILSLSFFSLQAALYALDELFEEPDYPPLPIFVSMAFPDGRLLIASAGAFQWLIGERVSHL